MTLVLAGDVGGTKTLLALAEPAGESVRIVSETLFPSPRYPGLAPIVLEFLKDVREPVAAACFGLPGPVIDGACRTPNLPWSLTEQSLAQETGLAQVRLINDFAAAAVGMLALPTEAFVTLQEGIAETHGTRAVIGAGTGLGQAVLFWDGRRYRANPTEGGHAGFSPRGSCSASWGPTSRSPIARSRSSGQSPDPASCGSTASWWSGGSPPGRRSPRRSRARTPAR